MDPVDRLPARVSLRAHEPTPATLHATRVPQRERTTRAVFQLLGFWLLVPVVALIPPHAPWAIAALLLGLYFFRRSRAGALVVQRFQGRCPRCGGELHLQPGTRIRVPHPLGCPHCHFEPVLETGAPTR